MSDPIGDEALRMDGVEHLHSSFDKLRYEDMVEEIGRIHAKMQALLPVNADNWPEFNTLAAKLRGFSFNAFSMSQRFYRPPDKRHMPRPEARPAPTPKAASVDDIFGAL